MRSARPLGPADYALLGLLKLRPRHGYELAEWLGHNGELGEVCAVRPSLLYANLKRLETLGYIEPTVSVVGARPPRHVYHLTEAGEREFSRWLDRPVRRNREIRMEFLLKLYFSERIPEHDTVRLTDAQLRVAREELAVQEVDYARQSPGSFRRLLRQVRLGATRGTIRWLEEYREDLIRRISARQDEHPESPGDLNAVQRQTGSSNEEGTLYSRGSPRVESTSVGQGKTGGDND